MSASLVGSEMCIRDRLNALSVPTGAHGAIESSATSNGAQGMSTGRAGGDEGGVGGARREVSHNGA
eukprot:9961896-Alexandrium_andersonii.AAC.1